MAAGRTLSGLAPRTNEYDFVYIAFHRPAPAWIGACEEGPLWFAASCVQPCGGV